MDKKQLLLEQRMMPPYPRTLHLPHKPNASADDIVAQQGEATVLFGSHVTIEEKIDGASVGISVLNGHPLVRNREHVLKKGFVKDTAAKKQFASLWNWFYENKDKFEAVTESGPYTIFGEWLLAQHGIFYDRLPALFIPYDVYNYDRDEFLSPLLSRKILTDAGFAIPTLRFQGLFEDTFDVLEAYANLPATWADGKAEGIYIKVCNGQKITHRFKMVREDFQRGALWSPVEIRKNHVC